MDRQLCQETHQVNHEGDQLASDVNMTVSEEITAPLPNARGHAPQRKARRVTINTELAKRRAKGKQLEIQFPKPFRKVCGKHARLFKSEISVIVRKEVPLQTKKWKDLEGVKPGTMAAIWRALKIKFPEISDQDRDFAMNQVEDQYNNRRYRLGQIYREKNLRSTHVSPEDWQWLIRNVWTNEDFVKRSKQNSTNRSKQEMGSKVGTKSITQIAFELRDKETGEWPTAMEVWKATYQKANGTWSTPNGEETLVYLCTFQLSFLKDICCFHEYKYSIQFLKYVALMCHFK